VTPFDFLLDTYDTERLKTLSVWSSFTDAELEFRPAGHIRTPHEHMVHQCVSEDAWMKNMMGIDVGEPALPQKEERLEFIRHYDALSSERLARLREKPEEWWREAAKFFDVDKPKNWIMLQRLTHSAQHRAQLVVYLRLLGRPPENPTERPAGFAVRVLQRAPIRIRETAATVSAWQLIADSERGTGSITLIDSIGQPFYRGDGTYFGWSQEQLAAEYQRLNKSPDEPTFEVAQLG
jgi:uncharacterized damage-inducible protein DinB